MKRTVLFTLLALTLSAGASASDTLSDTASSAAGTVENAANSVADAAKSMKAKLSPSMPAKPIAEWTCAEFLAVDESFRPSAVYFAEGFNQNDKPEGAMIDIAGVEKAIPFLIEDCSKNPQEKLLKQAEKTRAAHAAAGH
ncbi:acid-activated periplasmic chaperone HdeA [Plesiomonas shigelloides]|uniref:acid-activated periplasmic chaperone HdeA n=1 Tax=Plesiomonas shigelloides TaxID=703 RepID=UPI001261E633|nr:acid-activated periplasmic chaperone HdeA [Plesiomonas shigelloides]KAB7660587.1 hypothetical protein GBN14_02325 [Plesiomonas shigelloides]